MRWSDEKRTPFAVRMRAARTHSTLNQKDAAARIGIKQGTLSELEKSATKSAHTAKAAQVYGVSPQWLQSGDGEMLAGVDVLSARATYIATLLDAIPLASEFEQACVLCEAFAALASAGQLSTVARQLSLVALAPAPTPETPPGYKKRSGAPRQGQS